MLKFHCGIETFVKIVIFVVHLPFSMLILLMSVMLHIDTKQICTKIAWFFLRVFDKKNIGSKYWKWPKMHFKTNLFFQFLGGLGVISP